MISFGSPYFLLLLLTLIVPAWRIIRPRSYGEIIFGSVLCLPQTKLTWRILLSRILPILYLLSLALVVVALARPQSILSTTQVSVDAIAIEMVLDTSGSMETIDTDSTSRLDIAKESFITFVEKRENDLIGLITFSGYATTKAPLTTNHDILLQLIETVATPNSISSLSGNINKQETLTAIGDAITTACARLKTTEPISKIIILVTDGISNAGIIEPLKSAHIAKKLNIKIYPINIGSRIQSSSGNLPEHSIIENQQTALLNEIADITGGKMFSTIKQGELKNVLAEIDTLEKTEIETSHQSEITNFSSIFIITALLLIITSATINISITRRLI